MGLASFPNKITAYLIWLSDSTYCLFLHCYCILSHSYCLSEKLFPEGTVKHGCHSASPSLTCRTANTKVSISSLLM